jgi:hypothetical protein
LGWVFTVIDKLNKFTNTPDEQKAIDDYVAKLKWGGTLKTISRGKVSGSGMNDYKNGRRAGAGVEIQHGIADKGSGALLLEGKQ